MLAQVEAAEAYEPLEHRSFEELEDSAADSLNPPRLFLSGGFGGGRCGRRSAAEVSEAALGPAPQNNSSPRKPDM